MPKIHDMLESKFLRKEDVGAGVLYTVEAVIQKNIAKEGAEPVEKWCMNFRETDKPLVLNSTNIQLCQTIFGSDDTDDWVDQPIVLYTDPSVSFQGKVIGGIRVRKPKVKAAPKPVQKMVEEDDIPFVWAVPFLLPTMLALHVVLA